MKKTAAILCMLAAICLSACNPKDKLSSGDICIEFLFDEIDVDLNISDNPYITCVINSANALESVSMFLEYADGTTVPYKEEITSFFNPEVVSLYERPVYSEDMAGFTVKAVDAGGFSARKTVSFNVMPVVMAPEIRFNCEAISFSEGEPIAPFGFTVGSMAPLRKVSVEIIESGEVASLLEDITDFSSDPLWFDFSSANYPVGDYDPGKIPGAIRVSAVDTYGKVSIATLPIVYHSLPFPVVSAQDLPAAAEFSSIEIKGSASSESLISQIRCYAIGDKYEHLCATLPVEDKPSVDFSITVPAEEIQEFVTGIKVVAKDCLGKETSKNVSLDVIPGFWPLGAGDDLLQFIKDKSQDTRFRSIKVALPQGSSYDLGASSITLLKSLYLKGSDTGEKPLVTTSASEPLRTDVLSADFVKFENIHFKSLKSGNASFINNSGGCAIGEISLKSCLFDGTYGNYLIRAAGNCKIGLFSIDDCIFRWVNTNSTYSLIHITSNADKVDAISVSNSSFEGVFYLIYNNEKDTNCDVSLVNCSFANSKASSNSYFISIGQSGLKGTFTMKKCLFGGTCNLTGTSRFIVSKSLESSTADNYCTKTWMSFSLDSATANAYFPVTVLAPTEDNAQVFNDAASFDLTLKQGTTPYNAAIGDPRWIISK